jgi:hypothetical protein
VLNLDVQDVFMAQELNALNIVAEEEGIPKIFLKRRRK